MSDLTPCDSHSGVLAAGSETRWGHDSETSQAAAWSRGAERADSRHVGKGLPRAGHSRELGAIPNPQGLCFLLERG